MCWAKKLIFNVSQFLGKFFHSSGMVYDAGVGFQILFSFSINLLLGYITVDYQLIVYRKIVACVIVYVTLFQTDET